MRWPRRTPSPSSRSRDVYETAPVGGPVQDDFLNAVVAIETDLAPHELLAVAMHVEQLAARIRIMHWGPRTLDVDVLLYGDEQVQEPDLEIPHPRMHERPFVLAPLARRRAGPRDAARRRLGGRHQHPASITPPLIQSGPFGPEPRGRVLLVNGVEHTGALALVGPGRAGTTIAAALADRGWRVVAVAGRTVDAPSTRAAAARFGAPAVAVADAGADADLVIVATPDAAIDGAAAELAASVRPDALGHPPVGRGVDSTCSAAVRSRAARCTRSRPSRPSKPVGPAWPGPGVRSPATRRPGCSPSSSSSRRRRSTMRTGSATTRPRASRPTIWSRCSTRCAGSRRSRSRRTSRWCAPRSRTWTSWDPRPRSTGPVARGDAETVRGHLDAFSGADRDAYRDLARLARELSGRRDPALDAVLAMIVVERVAELREACDARGARAGPSVWCRRWATSTRVTVR